MRVKYVLFLVVTVAMISIAFGAFLAIELTEEDPKELWQAALHISNWTNRTLDIDIYVFAGDTLLYSITVDHEENVTLTVTWHSVKETITFLHCVGDDIDGWLVYELEPGEWESVILL